jgi:hypothetical protein
MEVIMGFNAAPETLNPKMEMLPEDAMVLNKIFDSFCPKEMCFPRSKYTKLAPSVNLHVSFVESAVPIIFQLLPKTLNIFLELN